jgi:photosystem II stability/assembly factor-like uncharacterized protein
LATEQTTFGIAFMRKSRCRKTSWITLLAPGWLCSLLLWGWTASSNGGFQDVSSPPAPSLETGPYYGLIIGNNDYKYLNKLLTPVNDANEVAQLLRQRYGFETEVLLDADREQILTALVKYRTTLDEHSNLLIYYAGHGHHDTDADEAYWLPVDAQKDSNTNWISADDITRDVKAIPSKHVLIISDSCYSGYLVNDRSPNAGINPEQRHLLIAKMLRSKSRNLMSSGGDEPVADTGAPGHSVFAAAILESLLQIEDDDFTALDLFNRFIQPQVGGRSDQLPQYSWIRNSGHEHGDFVFSRRPDNVSRSPGIVGWGVGHRGTILHTENGGITWKQQKSGTSADLNSVAFVTLESGWAVGNGGTILHTEDGGSSWRQQISGTRAWIRSVAFATPSSGWAVGYEGTILHTQDGGGSWKAQESGTRTLLLSVAFVTEQSGWVVGGRGTILHTEDGGRTWEPQVSGTMSWLFSVAFATSRSGWAVGDKGTILHTEDGGRSWKSQTSGARAELRSVAFVTEQSGWVVGGQGTILHTEDSGSSWTTQVSGIDAELGPVAFGTLQSGWTVGDEGPILHTVDGGRTWRPQGETGSLSGLSLVTSLANKTIQSNGVYQPDGSRRFTEGVLATWLSGTVTPRPRKGELIRVLVEGEDKEATPDEFGRFKVLVHKKEGTRVRVAVYRDGKQVYDDFVVLPGPATLLTREPK